MSLLWRASFVLSGLLILIGGPRHPGGTMAQMLAHPQWVPSHAFMLAGFTALLIGLLARGRSGPRSPALRRWLTLAIAGTALQTVEMALHTAAYVDLANLLAGRSTPVLTAHLSVTPLFYPIFGVTVAGWIAAAARERAVGSAWIAWIGIVGVLAHGAAGVLVPVFALEWARVLFPMVVLLAVWSILAGLWPARAGEPATMQSAD